MFLQINNLEKFYGEKDNRVQVLKGLSTGIEKGEICVLLGPSGSGKSTLLNIIGGIESYDKGEIIINGAAMSAMNEKQTTLYRREHLGYVFQFYNLIPNLTVKENIEVGAYLGSNPLDVDDLLHTLGLWEHKDKIPSQLSGGQRQRIGIARALAVEPSLIIADEPVSALDVSIQAQVLNLLNELKHDLDLTYIFVAHDLSVVEYISDRVGVMYLGNFVEVGEKEKIYSNPMHPYTQALLSAVPVPDPTAKRERILLEGSIPSAHKPPTGCKFHTRCPKCMECCKTQAPERYEVDDGHYVYCHLYDKERREQQK